MRRTLEVAEERILVAVAGSNRVLKRQRTLGRIGLLGGGLRKRGVAERDYLVVASDSPVVADALEELLRLESTVILCFGETIALHDRPILQRIALLRNVEIWSG